MESKTISKDSDVSLKMKLEPICEISADDKWDYPLNKSEDNLPLDLSTSNSKCNKVDYSTDDSEEFSDNGQGPNCKAYKKSLMKRYCESHDSISNF
ncbi:unnamed protein product [Bemisia tabaci]|uniref:Uncharacterized protein n=1 Tax=Bemisia tabaci TaxID=7038 RepID=A0A9P0A8V4_BEMTA|nr:unnamed protein product [Bemisia tabaci]